uniref:Uncharacterized protein n=1 Tax=Arundo donax TaxID=35708 RepID=A0A0A8ZZV2_ARUDO
MTPSKRYLIKTASLFSLNFTQACD